MIVGEAGDESHDHRAGGRWDGPVGVESQARPPERPSRGRCSSRPTPRTTWGSSASNSSWTARISARKTRPRRMRFRGTPPRPHREPYAHGDRAGCGWSTRQHRRPLVPQWRTTRPLRQSRSLHLSPERLSRATVTVGATASDNVGVVGVQFTLDGADLGVEDTTSPYSQSWTTSTSTNGSHTLTAVARDAAGNTKTSASVTVTVAQRRRPTGGLDHGADEWRNGVGHHHVRPARATTWAWPACSSNWTARISARKTRRRRIRAWNTTTATDGAMR